MPATLRANSIVAHDHAEADAEAGMRFLSQSGWRAAFLPRRAPSWSDEDAVDAGQLAV
jgi:hypothetical protein